MDRPDQLDIDELAAAIVRQAADRPRILIGIDGPGASGKSTLARLLSERLEKAVIVQADDFYLPSAMRARRMSNVAAPYDLPRLARQVVHPAASGDSLRYQRYDWDRDAMAGWIEVPKAVPVIVEGVYALQQQLRNAYTYSIYCRADAAVRLSRGLKRDGLDARARWVDEWMPQEDRYVSSEHPDEFARLVVNSSLGVDGQPAQYRIDRWRDR